MILVELFKQAKSGLTSNQIKWIAVVFMTIDHIGANAFDIQMLAEHSWIFKLLGRIAAPLFLYMVTESCRHTKSKPRYIARLYIAGVSVGLFTAVTNFLFGEVVGYYLHRNMIFTYFYTALYIFLIENALLAIKEKNYKQLAVSILFIAATYIPHLIYLWFGSLRFSQLTFRTSYFVQGLFRSFILSPFYIEYSLVFVLLGVAMYFSRTKFAQCAVFSFFCILSYFGRSFVLQHNLSQISGLFGYPQYWMVLALPFMIFYNGKRGRSQKLFFYVYYPTHRYIISIIIHYLLYPM